MKTLRLILLFTLIVVTGQLAFAQVNGNEVLIDIEDDKITVDEFLYVYKKNNPVEGDIDQQDLLEYLDLYINFRLKVKEAEELGLDTVSAFIKELEGYRKQLAQPYFIDEEVDEFLVRQAYDRKKIDIRASHLLIRVDKDAAPEDTIAAYNKIMDLRKEIVDGKDFGQAAVDYSDDPSAKDKASSQGRPARKGNHGDLGYFTVFDMVYSFENGAYNTAVGDVSDPVSSEYGYLLVRVTDRQEALGPVQVAHVFVPHPKTDNPEDSLKTRNKIYVAYDKLKEGTSFEQVVSAYSEDKGSIPNGGKLPWFGANRMVPDFIVEIRQLKNPGDYTEPFTTRFGWHIAQMIERKPVGSFEDEKTGLENRISKDRRASLSSEAVITRIKNEYGFKQDARAREELIAVIDSTLLAGTWNSISAASLDDILFSIGDKEYTQYEFAQYLGKNQHRTITSIVGFYNEQYEKYTKDAIVAYEDSKLEEKYPEFRMLVQEYHDGILLFDLTDQKVWSKAVKDTVGLSAFYENNKASYMWEKRVDASIYRISDPGLIDMAALKSLIGSGAVPDSILNSFNSDTLDIISVNTGIFEMGDAAVLESVTWKKGLSDAIKDNGHVKLVYINKVLKPGQKELDDARGLITADYQGYLESAWLEELKEKYTVTIKEDILEYIK